MDKDIDAVLERLGPLTDLDLLKQELARRSLPEFVKQAWAILEPGTPLEWNWHIDAICEHLVAVQNKEIKNLIINIPPGFMKSLLVAVFWPAWRWLHEPAWRSIYSSYAEKLTLRDNDRARQLIQSDWYHALKFEDWTIPKGQNKSSMYGNSMGGLRIGVSIGGMTTGLRGDTIVCDDPNKVEKGAYNVDLLHEVLDWWEGTMSSRVNDPVLAEKIIIQQRVHDADLTGLLQAKYPDNRYEYLCLPMEFDPQRKTTTVIGWSDPRTEEDELLMPQKYTPEVVEQMKSTLTPDQYSGQMNQEPAPKRGGLFDIQYVRFWYPSGRPEPAPHMITDPELGKVAAPQYPLDLSTVVAMCSSWDCTFKESKTADYVVGQAWGKVKGNNADFFLLDQVRRQMGWMDTRAAIFALKKKWPKVTAHYIEDKANGSSIIDDLQKKLPGVIAINPEGGKYSRANAVSDYWKGNIYLPHPQYFPWMRAFLKEVTRFPKSVNDDQVDAMSQCILKFQKKIVTVIINGKRLS